MIHLNSPIKVGNDFRECREDGSEVVGGKVTVSNYNPEVPVIHLTEQQIEFLSEGNVIPQEDGTYYMVPFVYKRLGHTNLFEQYALHKIDLAKVGFPQETLNEFKSSYSMEEQIRNNTKQ